MRLWKIALLLAIVGSGFGTGYLWKRHQAASFVHPQVAAARPTTPEIDPSLMIPAPPPNGIVADQPLEEVRNHFREMTGLSLSEGASKVPSIRFDEQIAPIEAQNNWPVPELVPPPNGVGFANVPPRQVNGNRNPWRRQSVTCIYTNHRDVQLNFSVTRQGIAEIKAVELWCRRSADSIYQCVDRMEGCKPPFSAHLWTEGEYEFRLVVVDVLGGKAIPADDDVPDIRVCLDTTLPIIEMQRPVLDSPGVIKLSWLAGDRNLEDKPVCLEYSEDGQTWKPLAEREVWLANTGQYLWAAPEGLSQKVRFRARVRDKAGNVACSSTPKTNDNGDYVLPEARIVGAPESLPAPREVGVVLPPGRYLEHMLPYSPQEPNDLFSPELIAAPPREVELLPNPREAETETLPAPPS